MTLCVYAVCGAGHVPEGTGIGGEPLRAVRAGRVAAIAGELRRPPSPTPVMLRRYDLVVRRLSEQLPALLPARFGTCFAHPEELTHLLAERGRTFSGVLRHVRGRVQMNVRVLQLPTPNARLRTRQRPQLPRQGIETLAGGRWESGVAPPLSGAGYLRQRAAAAARARHVEGFDPVRAAVARWIRDERVDRHGAIASVYHLVPRASAESYRAAAQRAAAEAGIRMIVTGPWAPYAFGDPVSDVRNAVKAFR